MITVNFNFLNLFLKNLLVYSRILLHFLLSLFNNKKRFSKRIHPNTHTARHIRHTCSDIYKYIYIRLLDMSTSTLRHKSWTVRHIIHPFLGIYIKTVKTYPSILRNIYLDISHHIYMKEELYYID